MLGWHNREFSCFENRIVSNCFRDLLRMFSCEYFWRNFLDRNFNNSSQLRMFFTDILYKSKFNYTLTFYEIIQFNYLVSSDVKSPRVLLKNHFSIDLLSTRSSNQSANPLLSLKKRNEERRFFFWKILKHWYYMPNEKIRKNT